MNLDDLFDLNASNPLVATNPLLLAGSVLAALLIAWLCVHKYANTNDIKRSLKLYVPIELVCSIVFCVLGTPLIYSIGSLLCGLAVLVWLSNYYFYH